ncbi:MAG: Ig-like domain-containing protein [Chloroflexi bacterium]|nr:Ig-like domain-containing protein [Chloroflexota bacterium]
MVSNLAVGEPPRFAPAGSASGGFAPAAAGGWSAVGNQGINAPIYAIAFSGSDVYVGGDFTNAAGIPEADGIAKWDGTAWSALGSSQVCIPFLGCHPDGALQGVRTIVVAGNGDLYVGGTFANAANIPQADGIARWDGTNWSALGSNPNGTDGPLYGPGILGVVNALALSGTSLYVGGSFDNAGVGGVVAHNIAKWDISSSTWSALGDGLAISNTPIGTSVLALAIIGSNLYVGGGFRNAAGIAAADGIVSWNGSSWSALGANVTNDDGALNGGVRALAALGSDLYVGGGFGNVGADANGNGGIPQADLIAKWDGSTWSALGSNPAGTDGALNGGVVGMAVFGTDLYVGGFFNNVAGIPQADCLAKWDGGSWSALGSSVDGTTGAFINCVAVTAVGTSSTTLYAGGQFQVDGVPAAVDLARWALVPPVITSIDVTPTTPTIPNGTDRQFTATGTYSDGSTADITGSAIWASATPAVATIGGTGLAHAVGQGTSSISASLDGVSGSTLLTVGPPTLVSIAVTPSKSSIPAGANQQFTATGSYSDASTLDLSASVSWASANSSVATISASGLAHGVSKGSSSMSATLGAVSGSTLLTVTPPVPALVYTGPTSAAPGLAITLTATLKTSAGVALSGKVVSFTINGATLTATTTKTGLATAKTKAPAATGSYPIVAAFAGDASYAPVATTTTLAVRIATKLVYTGPTRVTHGAPMTLTATLTTAAGAPIAGVTVAFVFDGGFETAITNAAGVATVVTDAPLVPGRYPMSVQSTGDTTYGAASAALTLTVR